MRIGFVINDIETEEVAYTTTPLAMAAVNRGHESWQLITPQFSARIRLRKMACAVETER